LKEKKNMTNTLRLKTFSRALTGIIYPEDYLKYSTDGQIPELIGLEHLITVEDSRRNLRNDLKLISADVRKSIDAAKIKLNVE
jgi:hypothetical protein